MILIVSHKEDYTTDYLVNILNKRNAKYHRLNTEDIETRHKISLQYQSKSITKIDNYDCFHSVWFRRTKLPDKDFCSHTEKNFYNRDFRLFLSSLWQTIKANKWLSKPEFIYKAENKLLQLYTAQKLGFNIPETIISTDKSKIMEFYRKYNGNIILKPLFGGKYFDGQEQKLIFTNKVKEEHLKQNAYILFPIIFQEEIKKEYELRITVVNDKVFSAKVDSQSNQNTIIDWRKEQLKFERYSLPIEIKHKCIELTKQLGLNFGAVDLIKTKNDYIFLEINPNGQWVWIENDTGLKISDAIIDYLTN